MFNNLSWFCVHGNRVDGMGDDRCIDGKNATASVLRLLMTLMMMMMILMMMILMMIMTTMYVDGCMINYHRGVVSHDV